MSKEPSALAREKAEQIVRDHKTMSTKMILDSGGRQQRPDRDLIDDIASALSEQAEAVRVLAEVIESREQSRMNFVAGAARSVAAMQALSNNPIARAAVEAAKGSQ